MQHRSWRLRERALLLALPTFRESEWSSDGFWLQLLERCGKHVLVGKSLRRNVFGAMDMLEVSTKTWMSRIEGRYEACAEMSSGSKGV